MYRKILIMPYFGTFPPYFDLWVSSCGQNPDIDWLVITDNPPPDSLPSNMKWIMMTFGELREYFQKRFDFRIWLKKPYKLCDYKGFYGYLFSDYTEGYDFWGYCDCDVIFGRIGEFLPDSLFTQYDKLLRTGHLSFVRNKPEINRNFLKYDSYRRILSSPVIYVYDEVVDGFRKGLAGELVEQGYRFYQNDALVADIDFRHFPFRIVTAPERCCVFAYRNGRLYQYEQSEEGVCEREAFYLHLQKRKMSVPQALDPAAFLIYPNAFAQWHDGVLADAEFWDTVSQERKDYFDFAKERRDGIKRDIRRLMWEPNAVKALRYRFGR